MRRLTNMFRSRVGLLFALDALLLTLDAGREMDAATRRQNGRVS